MGVDKKMEQPKMIKDVNRINGNAMELLIGNLSVIERGLKKTALREEIGRLAREEYKKVAPDYREINRKIKELAKI